MYQVFRSSLAIAVFATCLLVANCQAIEPTIEVAGVQVIRQGFDDGFPVHPFNSQSKGTRLALLVKSSDASIISLDLDSSKIDAFVDNTRHSLLVEKEKGGFFKGEFGNKEGLDPFPKVSQDGKAALVTVVGNGLPASGATKVGVKGTLVVQLGGKSKAFKSDPVQLKKDLEVSVDDINFKVTKIEKPSFGDDQVEISIQSNSKSLALLKGVKFYNASGREIQSSDAGSSKMGAEGDYTYGLSFRLKEKLIGKTQVELEKWTDLREEKIAISVSAGLGG